ncbi:MAG: response regulator [Planctomycetota bacterium]|nr:response regulator [Planctomycetota bacterium]
MSSKNHAPDKQCERPHILLVDDEAFIRDALELYFESNGFEVSTAADGSEALKIFSEQAGSIDLVLLDLVMPGMHGLEVLRELKKTDPSAQIIIATGCNSMDNAFEALRLGAIDYITKPILDFEDDLLKTVEAVLEGNAAPGEAAPEKAGETPRQVEDQDRPQIFEKKGGNTSLLIEELAHLGGSRLETPREQALAWKTLEQGLGVHAALVINQEEGASWQCLQNWGFSELSTPRDLWHTGDTPRNTELPVWSGVLHIPFGGNPGEELLLLLFYREVGDSQPADLPLKTLSAVFSQVYRADQGEADTIESVTADALDPQYNS